MTRKLLMVLVATIVISGGLFLSQSIQEVDAIKGKGVSSSKYGSATKYQVCGGVLCSEYPGGYDQFKRDQEQSSASSEPVTPSAPGTVDTGSEEKPKYNEQLNPRQTEYENILGFNDLHIEAINHLLSHGDESNLDVVVHHHCKVYNDMTAACLLFPTGMGDQDKPYGMEYVISAEAYADLPDEEKKYWHYHKTELPKVAATLPDLTADEAEPLMPVLNETYGKVVYFWQLGDDYPIGQPFVVIIQDLYE